MPRTTSRFLDKKYWMDESARYNRPHFRLEKCARIVNQLAGRKDCDLLDIGCGPATLATLLDSNIHYYGIDIAIHNPAPNLLEFDFAAGKIGYENKTFDIAVAAGVFEYMGDKQKSKLNEIASLLKENGKFVVTYTNFHHLHSHSDYYPYNNVLALKDFKSDLETYFQLIDWFPSSHNLEVGMGPTGRWSRAINMNMNFRIPVVSQIFAVSYFFICSPKRSSG